MNWEKWFLKMLRQHSFLDKIRPFPMISRKLLSLLRGVSVNDLAPAGYSISDILWKLLYSSSASNNKIYNNGDYYTYLNLSSFTEFLRAIRGFEPDVYKLFSDVLKPRMIVVDVGAHKGTYTLLAATKVGHKGRVIAFEPDQRTFEFLNKAIKYNGFTNISTYNMAVLDKEGTSKLLTNGVISVRLDLKNEAKTDGLNVKTISLGEFLNEKKINHIDILKIDAEGSEKQILSGLLDISVDMIFCELHKDMLPNGTNDIAEIYNNLVDKGMYVYSLSQVEKMNAIYSYRQNNIRFIDHCRYLIELVEQGHTRHIFASKNLPDFPRD